MRQPTTRRDILKAAAIAGTLAALPEARAAGGETLRIGLVQVEQHSADGVLPHGADAVGEDQPARRSLDRRAAVAELDQLPRALGCLDGDGRAPAMAVR